SDLKADIGAPGVGIKSIIPKVYSADGTDIFSTSSGTSMAAPYISNLAAQILNANPKLKPWQIKKIIMETGDEKEHLEDKLVSGAIANNAKALKAANLSKEISLEHAIQLATLKIVPLQDEISLNITPAKIYQETAKKVMESVPSVITPAEVNEEVEETPSTKSSSSQPIDQEKVPQDNSVPLPSIDSEQMDQVVDQDRSNETSELSQKPSEDLPPSSSEPQPEPPAVLPQEGPPSLAKS